MRDPSGYLSFDGDRAIRHLNSLHDTTLFLKNSIATSLVRDGLIVPFEFSATNDKQIESPRYKFVSLPTEWTDSQLLSAAQLTLEIADAVLDKGFELKDASAWNIIFEGTVPRFCDHLSFEPIASRHWWAFGQFCRHFTFPLACSLMRGMHSHNAFQLHRDGLHVAKVRKILGLRGRLSRLYPLLIQQPLTVDDNILGADMAADRDTLHRSLIDYGRYSLFDPKALAGSVWSNYVLERAHYTKSSMQVKIDQLRLWFNAIKPRVVLDLGCNTGEFSKLALEFAQLVIALDSDHDCVQKLYLDAQGNTRLHPIVADLGDLLGARGWASKEFPSLLERLSGKVDLVLMLALVHHLHFAEGIPMPEVAKFAANLTTSDLIVELIEPADKMVCQLAQRRRKYSDLFSIDMQLLAFQKYFETVEHVTLPDNNRHLLRMRLRA
jgi:SAM-dependent methyltransferase